MVAGGQKGVQTCAFVKTQDIGVHEEDRNRCQVREKVGTGVPLIHDG